MKAKELRDLPADELRQRLQERVADLRHFRVQMATGAVENVKAPKQARKDVARIKTILREREIAAANEAKKA